MYGFECLCCFSFISVGNGYFMDRNNDGDTSTVFIMLVEYLCWYSYISVGNELHMHSSNDGDTSTMF